jgi:8-oxo-dGTP pyrophosphatase MutT (NUDIX family)
MSSLLLYPGEPWLRQLHERLDAPPRQPRVPLTWVGIQVGSVEPELMRRIAVPQLRDRDGGYELTGELTASLAAVAHALRAAGVVYAWRDELVAVRDERRVMLGKVERGVVRILGIATDAVHLLGVDPEGAQWMQQRAFDKPDDPGLWDTMVGGLVGADESLEESLARETWEEAGLRLAQLRDLRKLGTFVTRRPKRNQVGGYLIERLTWWGCTVPEGTEPVNRDGEVAQFRRMDEGEIARRLELDEFTLDASLMLAGGHEAR